VAHYLFNVSDGDRAEVVRLLRAKTWGVGLDERYRDELAPGDLALIYVAADAAFIGCVELATPVEDGGALLSQVEVWDAVVPMDAVVRRIDPTGSNPIVQANAAAGFRAGVVRITEGEYEAALGLSRETG
jgi:hypothetical protein